MKYNQSLFDFRLEKFGAAVCKFDHGSVIYASRPGHRLWLADKLGKVQQTLIFKPAVQSTCPKIQLINPIIKKEPYDTSFGKVLQLGDNKLISYNSETLYILHPGAVSVVSVLCNARKILDLAVNENEIFILEGERSLLRISPVPDKYCYGTINPHVNAFLNFCGIFYLKIFCLTFRILKAAYVLSISLLNQMFCLLYWCRHSQWMTLNIF